jgi:hypothetical protein
MAKIATARDYFEQVVLHNMQQYKANPSSLPAAFNLANCLFSMHEWMWNTYECKLGSGLCKKHDYNAYVQDACSEFKHIRDLSNASKHVFLTSPSTKATHITDTSSVDSKWGEGVYGVSKYGRGVVVISDGDVIIDFETAADIVFDYWQDMLGRMG